MNATTTVRPRSAAPTRRNVTASAVGNALEWYDWNSYVAFAVLFAPQFFAESSATAAFLGTLAVFAVGFLFRPLGGMLIGAFSDRRGRRAALTLSIMLMAGGSLLIALAPTYEQVGMLAPALLLLARVLQGLSAGGEVTAMSTFIIETAPPSRRGLYSSVIYISTTAGMLAATLLAVFLRGALSPAELQSWGWRLPFLLGALIALYGWYLRRGLAETGVFGATQPARRPAWNVLRQHPRASLRVAGFTIGTTAVYYTFAVYLPTYAEREFGLSPSSALWASVCAQLVFAASLPLLGALADRFGRRPLLLVFGAGFTLLSPLLFGLIGTSAWSLFGVMAAALVLFGCCAAAAPAAMLEMFPTRVRSSGIGLPYSATVAVFGGTAPYLVEYLSAAELGHWYPWYVALLCLISTLTFWRYRETKDVDLANVDTDIDSR